MVANSAYNQHDPARSAQRNNAYEGSADGNAAYDSLNGGAGRQANTNAAYSSTLPGRGVNQNSAYEGSGELEDGSYAVMPGEEESDGYLNMADANNPTGRGMPARGVGPGYMDMKAVSSSSP